MAGPDQGDGSRIELGGWIPRVSQAWVGVRDPASHKGYAVASS